MQCRDALDRRRQIPFGEYEFGQLQAEHRRRRQGLAQRPERFDDPGRGVHTPDLGSSAGAGRQRHDASAANAAFRVVEQPGDLGRGAMTEEFRRVDDPARPAGQFVPQLQQGERMPTGGEEVVVHADGCPGTVCARVRTGRRVAQHGPEGVENRCLGGGSRFAHGLRPGRFGQSAYVDLARAAERQVVEYDDPARHHVPRQRRSARGPELGGRHRRCHHIGHEGWSDRTRPQDGHRALGARPHDHRVDLGGFHSLTPDLDLTVRPADVDQLAGVAIPPHQVPGAVAAHAVGAGDERRSGERRVTEIATGDPGSADVQLADDTRRDVAQLGVEHLGADARARMPQSDRVAAPECTGGHGHRRLGGAVDVENLGMLRPHRGQIGRECLAADVHQAQRTDRRRSQCADDRRRRREDADPGAVEEPGEVVPAGDPGRDHHEGRAGGEWQQHVVERGVESRTDGHPDAVVWFDVAERGHAVYTAMGDPDDVRGPGGTRRGDDVGQRVARHRCDRFGHNRFRRLGGDVGGRDHTRGRAGDHVVDPGRRVGDVDRYAHRADPADRPDRDDRLDRPRHHDGHRVAGTEPSMSHRAGGHRDPPVEFAVGQGPVLVGDAGTVAVRLDSRREELGQQRFGPRGR